jgi:hypothetical protein
VFADLDRAVTAACLSIGLIGTAQHFSRKRRLVRAIFSDLGLQP